MADKTNINELDIVKYDLPTMCIIHKGFRASRALSPASILGGKLISFKHVTPYEITHSTQINIQ